MACLYFVSRLPAGLAVLALVALGGEAGAAAKPKKAVAASEAVAKSVTVKPRATAKPKARSTVTAKSRKGVPLPRPRPVALAAKPSLPAAQAALSKAGAPKSMAVASASPMLPAELMRPAERAVSEQTLALHAVPTPRSAPGPMNPPADLAAVKRALEAVRRGRSGEATEIAKDLADPAARKVIEWAILRSPDPGATFERYAAFVRANPTWPSTGMLRRRAEGALWDDRRDANTVRAYFAATPPQSGKGRLALAKALLAQGDRAGAAELVREAWRRDSFTGDAEQQVIDLFRDLLTRADHKARMDRFLYTDEREVALRAANRLGGNDLAIAKARLAVNAKTANAGALLDAVPAEARRDVGYLFSRAQWLRRKDKIAEAAQVLLSVPHDGDQQHDLDEWWVERRLMARELLDAGDYQSAYRVARDAVPPVKENYRVDHEFTAGWIALRFLGQPHKALEHFARIPRVHAHPTSLARAEYWQGRALEAMGRNGQARTHYEAAARHSLAYYGQLARARLGLTEVRVRRPPEPSAEERAALRNVDIVRAVEILYAVDERDLVLVMVADLTDVASDTGVMLMIGQAARQHGDARAMLYVGKAAIARGLPLDVYAFPEIGMPKYSAIGPEIDRGLLYAIARQESTFHQKTVSSANAMGLMQVTPAAGRYIARKFGVSYDQKRLLSDPVYNTQFGAAELGNLLQDYRGSYLLTFVGYNAGRGRVRDWIARYGDPRDPKVDPIDWAERIPFSETRNYVQRVMENMQVFRARFSNNARLTIEADLRGGGPANVPDSQTSDTPSMARGVDFREDHLP
jgi:soluble lytic murein transglycosylase